MSAHGNYQSVTIASGGTASTGIEATGTNRGSFQLPSAFTGVTVTVQVSNANVATADLVPEATWTNCPVEGNEVAAITASTDDALCLPVKSANFRWLRLVSGSAEGAARTILIWTP